MLDTKAQDMTTAPTVTPLKWKRGTFKTEMRQPDGTYQTVYAPGLVSQCGTWAIRTDKGRRETIYLLTHTPTGASVLSDTVQRKIKQWAAHLTAYGLDWSFTDTTAMPHECRTALREVRQLWRDGHIV